MALLFDGAGGHHDYYLDGIRLPSVTQVLREQTLVDFSQVPPFILERARQRGSAVHALAHFYNEHDLDWTSVDPTYRPYLEAWVACVLERRIVPLLCERRLASRRHRVAGTLDLLAEVDGEGWLFDFATGDPEDAAKDFQTGAYLGMALEWAADDPPLAAVLQRFARWHRASVRLMKTGSFRVTEYTDVRDYSRFQLLAAAWHIRNERGAIVNADDLAA
jgi:hypothetical protein